MTSPTAKSQSIPLATAMLGTWQLLSRMDRNAAGERRIEPSLGEDPIALLYYDRSGHFAAQFMKRDRTNLVPDVRPAVPNNSSARGGYDAYFGTYSVDESTRAVAHRLTAALSPENVGHSFTRFLLVEGNKLTLTLDTATAQGEPVTRTLIWTRLA